MVRAASPQTRAVCGEHLDDVERIADLLHTTRATIIRSILADWFREHPDYVHKLADRSASDRADADHEAGGLRCRSEMNRTSDTNETARCAEKENGS
jgi:hypothetical protein